MSLTPTHLMLMLAINLVWGFNFVVSKIGLGALPPLQFTCLRFLILSIALLPFLRIWPGRMGWVLYVATTMGTLSFAFMFAALAVAEDVAVVAVAAQLSVPFSVLVAMAVLGERPNAKHGLGVLISFAGILVMSFDPIVLAYLDGLLLGVLGAFALAIGLPAMRKLKGVGVLELQAWIATVSWPMLLVLALFFERPGLQPLASIEPLIWGTVLYTAIGASLFGHGGMYFLVQRYDISQITPLTLLAPIFAIFFGVTLLGDNLTARMLAGGAMTLAGVYLVASRAPVGTPRDSPTGEA